MNTSRKRRERPPPVKPMTDREALHIVCSAALNWANGAVDSAKIHAAVRQLKR
jgi:hypothetical protein